MFSQRKSFLKGKLFYIILLGLFVFGVWLNQAPIEQKTPEDVNTDSNYPAGTEGAVNQKYHDNYDILDNIIGKTPATTQESIESSETEDNSDNPSEKKETGYYLVKEVNGVIKIFYYDEQGKETLLKETDIAFSLLSVADQALFQQGVIKHTSEELDELLQDFES